MVDHGVRGGAQPGGVPPDERREGDRAPETLQRLPGLDLEREGGAGVLGVGEGEGAAELEGVVAQDPVEGADGPGLVGAATGVVVQDGEDDGGVELDGAEGGRRGRGGRGRGGEGGSRRRSWESRGGGGVKGIGKCERGIDEENELCGM